MSTTSVSATIAQTSDATFRAWVSEVLTALVTTLGMTQTADTGQINTSTVTAPGAANTSQGYAILRFNDTLQSTSPVFIKLEFGSGNAAANPQMWITVGQGSNGSGTLTGTLTTRVVTMSGSAVASTSTSYTSRYVYNSTYGFVGVQFKLGGSGAGVGSPNQSVGGFYLMRSNDATGAATGDAVMLIANSGNTTGSGTNSGGVAQMYSYLSSAVFGPSGSEYAKWPWQVTTTTYSGDQEVVPVFMYTPKIQFSNYFGLCLISEVALGSTFSATIIGATALTYLSVGWPTGNNSAVAGNNGTIQTAVGNYMLWQ